MSVVRGRRLALQALALAPCWTAAGAAEGGSLVTAIGTPPAPERVLRVFAAGTPASVLCYVLAPHKLVGWPQPLAPAHLRYIAPAQRELPFVGRLASRGSTVSLEALLALKPDLILDAGTIDPNYRSAAERVAAQTGLPYLLVDGRLADSARQLREVGRLLGVAARGEALAAQVEASFAQVARLRDATPPAQRPSVYYGRGADGLETGLAGSINMEAIEFAGARNVAAAAGRGGLTRVSVEQILAWNPDLLLTQDEHFAQRLRSDPLWQALPAVRAGRVHRAPALPFGWLDGPPGVNRVLGLRWLLGRLYPDAATPPLDASGFYRDFFGSDVAAHPPEQLLDSGR